MCVSLDSPNENEMERESAVTPKTRNIFEDAEVAEQLRVYDEEVSRGIMHTRSYDIKMQQYRLTLDGHQARHE